jgi:hypothetical protein
VLENDLNYEVAMTEIMYPKSWYNITSYKLKFYVCEERTGTAALLDTETEKIVGFNATHVYKLVK